MLSKNNKLKFVCICDAIANVNQRFSVRVRLLPMYKGELSAVIARLMKCLPYSPVIRKWL